MTIMFDEGKPSLEDLQHHGVKGMKWGHRKKISTSDIKSARQRLRAIDRAAGNAEDRTVLAKTAAGRAKATKDFEKLQKDFMDSPDRAIATRMTRGEKAATLLIGGPLGLAVIGVNAGVVKGIERSQSKKKK